MAVRDVYQSVDIRQGSERYVPVSWYQTDLPWRPGFFVLPLWTFHFVVTATQLNVCKIFTHNEDIVRLNICESLNMLKISLLYLIKKLLYRYHWFLNSSLKKKWNVRTTITFALISKNINNFHFHFQKCFFACNTAMIQALYLHFWNKDGRGGAYSSNPWHAVFIIYPLECMNC